jgi:hypothetical protein
MTCHANPERVAEREQEIGTPRTNFAPQPVHENVL